MLIKLSYPEIRPRSTTPHDIVARDKKGMVGSSAQIGAIHSSIHWSSRLGILSL